MYKCVSYHRTYMMPKLLAAGANPHEPRGIVEHAVAKNDKDALIFLLDHNCDANARGEKNHTALTTAIRENRIEMIDILLAHGADPSVRGQEWPITLAVHNPEILAKLLPYIPKEKINKGAIEVAVVADQLDSVKLLLAKGMDVEGRTGGVFSPLTTSIRENRKSIFLYLCEVGADVNSPGEHLPIIKAVSRPIFTSQALQTDMSRRSAATEKTTCPTSNTSSPAAQISTSCTAAGTPCCKLSITGTCKFYGCSL